MAESRTDTLVCYGDSQTEGFSWGNRLPSLSDTLTTAVNRGVSGQEAGSVVLRSGGMTAVTTTTATITDTTPVIFGVQTDPTPTNIRSGSSAMKVEIAGVRGTVTTLTSADTPKGYPASSRAAGKFTMKFVPAAAPSSPVQVPVGTALLAEDVLDHPEYAECMSMLWVGGNDAAFAGNTRVTGVVAAAKAFVAHLKTKVDNPKFLVASRTTYSSEVEGTAPHQTAVDQRDALAAEFPDNAIDIWGHVRDNGLRILGITPTPEDEAALAGKSMPPSLTADGIHYTTAVREQVLAPFIIKELADRGWTVPKKEVPPVADYTPTHWENAPSKKTPVSAENLNNIETGIQSAKEASAAATQGVADLRETKADAATVTTALAGKVNAVPETQKNKIYGTGTDGKQVVYNYVASGADANSVAARSSSGNIMVSETPAADGHATSKKYVDTKLAALPAAPPTGTRAMLNEGTDTTPRLFAAKDIADYVAAKITELAQPKE